MISSSLSEWTVSVRDHCNVKTLVERLNRKMFNLATSEMFYPIIIRGEIWHKNVIFRHRFPVLFLLPRFITLPVVFWIFCVNVRTKKLIEVWYLSVFNIKPMNQWMSVKPMSDSFYMSRFIFNVPLSCTISHYRTVQPFWYWSSYLGCYRFFQFICARYDRL